MSSLDRGAASRRPLRVLSIDPSRALAGAEYSLLAFFEHVDRSRVIPSLVTQAGDLSREARRLDVRVHELPLPRLRREPSAPLRLLRGSRALARVARSEQSDVLHANTLRGGIYAGAVARILHRPLLWHVRDLVSPGFEARLVAWLAHARVAVSLAAASRLPGQVPVIPNGVLPEAYESERQRCAARSLRASWGVPLGALLVGQVARLQPWKGQRDVLAAAEWVLRRLPQTRFALVGGDVFQDALKYERELSARAVVPALRDRVRMVGQRTDVPVALAALDLLVHASHEEPFGRILVEAAASGVPVVAYASGGVPEIVEHGVTGLLVPDGDARALSESMVRLLIDRELARRLGEAARVRARQRFDIRPLTRDLEDLLARVAGFA